MIYRYVYISKTNKYNNLCCLVSTITKQYLVYKASMYNGIIDEKVKQLTYHLPKSEPIELATKRAFENLVKGLDTDEEFTRI